VLEKRKPIKRRGLKLRFPLSIKPAILVAFLIGISAGLVFYPRSHLVHQTTPQIEAYFSPGGHCTEKIIEAIDSTKSSIYVMAYSFTSLPIAHALVRAHERDVEVKILIDRSQLKAKCSQLHFLSQQGVAIYIDPAVGIAHNKVMILDEQYVLTGSFNFTHAAETKNAENILLIHDPNLARVYRDNWETRTVREKVKPYGDK
jgi:phospholipase D